MSDLKEIIEVIDVVDKKPIPDISGKIEIKLDGRGLFFVEMEYRVLMNPYGGYISSLENLASTLEKEAKKIREYTQSQSK